MAVFRGQEMDMEDLNISNLHYVNVDPTKNVHTKTPDQAEEKTPKSGMMDPAFYLNLKSAGALLSNMYQYLYDYNVCLY